ncbi:MAG: helix-turn-helix transcriptional regulator [Ruminococcus sp.]|nr:helix-turn-helix transcriptional regulator [Ruminococcus sp.]
MEDLYNRILQMGLDRGFKNMTEICAKSGVKRATMTEYKKGRTMGLSIDTLSKIAALYKTSLQRMKRPPKTKSPRFTQTKNSRPRCVFATRYSPKKC